MGLEDLDDEDVSAFGKWVPEIPLLFPGAM